MTTELSIQERGGVSLCYSPDAYLALSYLSVVLRSRERVLDRRFAPGGSVLECSRMGFVKESGR